MKDAILGAAIVYVGQLLAIWRGRQRRRTPKELVPVCGCKHHLSNHDPKTGACNTMTVSKSLIRYDDNDNPVYEKQNLPCPCRHYVGPVPAEMMLASWNPKGLD